MTVGGVHDAMGDGGDWETCGNQTLRGFVQGNNGTWTEWEMSSLLRYQLQDGEAVLFAFGQYNESQLQQMEASVPPPNSRRAPAAAVTDTQSMPAHPGDS
jgi:hypothetical protein